MAQALALRRQGFAFWRIGETMNISTPYAERLVKKALREIIKPEAEALLKLELDRLDTLFQPAFQAATYADPETGVMVFNKEATEVCLKIMERRAKFLGLDAPVKAEVNKNLNLSKAAVQIYLPHNERDSITIDNDSQEEILVEDDLEDDGVSYGAFMKEDVIFDDEDENEE